MAKLADLFVKLGLNSSSFNKGLDSAQKKTSVFSNGVKKIGGLIAGAFAVTQIVSFGKELVQLGGVAEGVRNAFERIAPAGTMEDLKKATAGTVSELELMKRAVSAKNLGLPVENLAKLFEFATKRAQETGESVDFLVNSIVTGIGRKSPLILDNLGISAIQLREKLKGVGFESAKVADIAAAVGEIAADSMRESGDIIDTNAVKISNLGAQWADLKLAIAENEAVTKSFADTLTKFQQFLFVIGSDAATGFEKAAISVAIFDKQAEAIFNRVKARADKQAEIDKQNKEAADFYKQQTEDLKKTTEVTKEHVKTLGELKEENDALKKSLDLLGVNQDAELQRTLKQIKANEELIKQLTTLRAERQPAPAAMETRGETPQIGVSFVPEEGLANMDAFFERMKDQLANFTEDYLSDWNQLGMALDALIIDGIIGMADEFGAAMEAIFAGDFNVQELGSRLLKTIGGFLGEFGKMLIAYGIAQEAFWTSLGLGPIGAPLAIAAGVALVAIGGAISGIGGRVSKGNLSTGGVGAMGTTSVTSRGEQESSVNLQGVLHGDSIYLSNQRNEFKRGVIG